MHGRRLTVVYWNSELNNYDIINAVMTSYK